MSEPTFTTTCPKRACGARWASKHERPSLTVTCRNGHTFRALDQKDTRGGWAFRVGPEVKKAKE
jgi:hypothetical protein